MFIFDGKFAFGKSALVTIVCQPRISNTFFILGIRENVSTSSEYRRALSYDRTHFQQPSRQAFWRQQYECPPPSPQIQYIQNGMISSHSKLTILHFLLSILLLLFSWIIVKEHQIQSLPLRQSLSLCIVKMTGDRNDCKNVWISVFFYFERVNKILSADVIRI